MRPGQHSLTQTSGSRTKKPISLRKNIPSQEKAGRTSKGLGSWKGNVGLKNILNERTKVQKYAMEDLLVHCGV